MKLGKTIIVAAIVASTILSLEYLGYLSGIVALAAIVSVIAVSAESNERVTFPRVVVASAFWAVCGVLCYFRLIAPIFAGIAFLSVVLGTCKLFTATLPEPKLRR